MSNRVSRRLFAGLLHLVAAVGVALAAQAPSVTHAETLIDFSDQTASFVTPVANPLDYPGASFSSASGLRVFSFTGLLDRGLCPHATNACRAALTIDFDTPVGGLGFDVFQVDERDSVLALSALTDAGLVTRSIALTRGFAANRIDLSDLVGVTRITLDGTSDEEGVIYDNFRFTTGASPGGAVPEPSAWILMLIGFGGLGAALRRRPAGWRAMPAWTGPALGVALAVSAAHGEAWAKGRAVDLPPGSAAANVVGYTKLMNKVPAPRGTLVHIPTFRVEIVREMQKSADTRNLGGSGYAHQMSTWRLDGVNDAELQRLTQALYDQLVADLKTQGYRVATPEETAADPDLRPLMVGRPSGARAPSADGASSFYAPAGLQVVVSAIDMRAAKPQGAQAFAAMGAATAAIGQMTKATRAASRGELVLEPKYALGFAELSSSSEGFGGRFAESASVSGKAGLRVIEEGTRIDVIEPKGGGVTTNAAFLTQTLMLAPQALGAPVNATTAEQRQGAMLGNLVGFAAASSGLSGSSVGMSTRAVPTTPAFAAITEDALSAVQGGLLERVLGAP
ncbi:MAG: PEPxxWA-CTERM sorting domain-containing protein [Pseudomonadota bacterium]